MGTQITSFTNPPHEGRVSLHEDRTVTIHLPMIVGGTCRECRHNSIGIAIESAEELSEVIADGTIDGKAPCCYPCWSGMSPRSQGRFICDDAEAKS